MIGHAPLREVVGADALGAVAAAHLRLAIRGARVVDLLTLQIIEAGAEHLHGDLAVAVLRLLGADHDDAGGNMGDADG